MKFINFLSSLRERQNSESLSFMINQKGYSYSDLFDYVEQIYQQIKDVPEKSIGLYAEDDIRTYAAIIALWYSGKAYVTLNPVQPVERHREIMESVSSNFVISPSDKYDIGVEGVVYIRTSGFSHQDYTKERCLPLNDYSDNDIAYIIFTSGSTGKPKGVQITRGNVAAFIDSMDKIGLNITEDDRCLQPFDLSFDFSVSSYIIPLSKGASIFTIPKKVTKYIYIAGLLEEYKLTVLQMVPSMIRNLLPYMDEVGLNSVRYNILCGEALNGKIIRRWHEGNPNMISYNMYGPTENTIFCTYYTIHKANIETILTSNDIVCIGKSFANSSQLLLDHSDKVISQRGVEGELCLEGPQLTPGYCNNPDENSSRFLFINDVRYYRTGDICYYVDDNNLMFVSRKDFQVKINGFRVELGEIENRYTQLSGGRSCVVVPYVDSNDNTELAIVIEGEEYEYKDHKTALLKQLPSYEVPAKWLFMSSLPLNQNGKLDRKQIKQHFNL